MAPPTPKPPSSGSPPGSIYRWVAAAICLAALAGGSHFVGAYLWESATGRATAFFVYLVWMALILGTAALFAGLMLRLFFPSHTAARPARRASREDDLTLAVGRAGAMFQPTMVYYSFLVVAAAVGAMFLAQWLSGGALFQFKIVQLEAMSRSDDPEEVKQLFEEIAEMRNQDEIEHFVKKLPDYFEHDREDVRGAAYQIMAAMAHRMNLSVYLLNREGRLLGDRWEPVLVAWMYAEATPRLKELYRKGTTPKLGIVRALAWIANMDDLNFFIEVAGDPATPDVVFTEAAAGLGNLGRFEGAGVLAEAIPMRKGVALTRLFWALQRIGATVDPDPMDEGLDQAMLDVLLKVVKQFPALDDASLCAAVHALWKFQHASLTVNLIELFESERGGVMCPRVDLKDPNGPAVIFIPAEELRWVLLNVLADIGFGNAELSAFANRSIAKDYGDKVNRGVQQLYGQLQAR
jgi:hypothetical protein